MNVGNLISNDLAIDEIIGDNWIIDEPRAEH
jgi:hypothetical protein